LAGNKSDLYNNEKVTYEEGLELAKSLNAIYQRTSAKEKSGGVEELFLNIGKKLLDPNSVIESHLTKEEKKNMKQKLLKEQIKRENKKKGCCS
jgi:GTPase SAR1 family protein